MGIQAMNRKTCSRASLPFRGFMRCHRMVGPAIARREAPWEPADDR